MGDFLNRGTLLTMISAFAIALLCILTETRSIFPFWIIGSGLQVCNTLFHEIGHTIFAWLLGRPAIPMIFTMFGADQAGGMTLQWDFNWFVQIGAFGALAYGCYWTREYAPPLFIPCILLSLFIPAIVFTHNSEFIIAYMGHGGAILTGGFLLFRAWADLPRGALERWLNALFGFFLTVYNLTFAYHLFSDSDKRADYSDHVAFGITHNDFAVMADLVPRLSVPGIAIFTMCFCTLVILGSFMAAVFLKGDIAAD